MRELSMPGAASVTVGRITRGEKRAALAEAAAVLLTFLVAFTGRSTFPDVVKTMLVGVSILIGAGGAFAGLGIIARGVASGEGRLARLALGGVMAFVGGYTIVHVLS